MALKGELSNVPINEIFSLIKNTKSSGVLFVDFEEKRFKIHFFNGEVINAEGDLRFRNTSLKAIKSGKKEVMAYAFTG